MTHIIPDGHDQNHGLLQSRVELIEPADLGKAVAVTESLELVGAELGSDVAAGGDALCCCQRASSRLGISSHDCVFVRLSRLILTVSAGPGIWIVLPS